MTSQTKFLSLREKMEIINVLDKGKITVRAIAK